MVSFTDYYNAISIDRNYKLKSKLEKKHERLKLKKQKLEEIHSTLIILFYGSLSFPQLQDYFF